MGDVYRATDRQTGTMVAVKVLRSSASVVERARFQREISVIADLRHPNIVEYIAHGSLPDGRPFYAMEWLDGEDLVQRQRHAPLGMKDAVEVVRRSAQAMAAVHARGIVHRDLKPDNIFLVNGEGDPLFVKLLDFGIAKALHAGPSGLTETGASCSERPITCRPSRRAAKRSTRAHGHLFARRGAVQAAHRPQRVRDRSHRRAPGAAGDRGSAEPSQRPLRYPRAARSRRVAGDPASPTRSLRERGRARPRPRARRRSLERSARDRPLGVRGQARPAAEQTSA
jgi:serine/threonine protein kinase